MNEVWWLGPNPFALIDQMPPIIFNTLMGPFYTHQTYTHRHIDRTNTVLQLTRSLSSGRTCAPDTERFINDLPSASVVLNYLIDNCVIMR